jgi:hypothetical protein
MENIFFKYGIILVGIVVIMLLINFAFRALNDTINLPEEDEDITGTKENVVIQLEKLCSNCIKEKIDKDCYIKEIQCEENITQKDFGNEIELKNELKKGNNLLKIQALNNSCVIRKID